MIRAFLKLVVQALDDANVSHVVVGGCAKLIYKWKESTSDIDILIDNSTENIDKFLGFTKKHFNIEILFTTLKQHDVLKIKAKPYSLDFHFQLDGVDNDTIFKRSNTQIIGQTQVQFISEVDLTKNINKVKKNGIYK